jgi:6-phosphogluconolactonase (cycloisomerase 2 family)
MKKIMMFLAVVLLFAGAAWARHEAAGAVYTMTNSAAGNEVLVLARAENGRLASPVAFSTGGLGTGAGLGNQGGLTLSRNQRWLAVVNAGSDDVSLFRVNGQGVVLADRISSGGLRPISVTLHRDLLYVLNAGGAVGGADNISGFRVDSKGRLTPIAGSVQPLSGANTDPAQIAFALEGRVLVVSEKATNKIVTYPVGEDGIAGPPQVHASAGVTPFGFASDSRDNLVVSEASGGARDASTVSSYELDKDGSLKVITAALPLTETAACWVAISNDGRFAYTTNTASDTLSGVRIASDGVLTLRDSDGRTASTAAGASPIDEAFSRDGRFLYVLGGGNGSISIFRQGSSGRLTALVVTSGLPLTVNGLAAR